MSRSWVGLYWFRSFKTLFNSSLRNFIEINIPNFDVILKRIVDLSKKFWLNFVRKNFSNFFCRVFEFTANVKPILKSLVWSYQKFRNVISTEFFAEKRICPCVSINAIVQNNFVEKFKMFAVVTVINAPVRFWIVNAKKPLLKFLDVYFWVIWYTYKCRFNLYAQLFLLTIKRQYNFRKSSILARLQFLNVKKHDKWNYFPYLKNLNNKIIYTQGHVLKVRNAIRRPPPLPTPL